MKKLIPSLILAAAALPALAVVTVPSVYNAAPAAPAFSLDDDSNSIPILNTKGKIVRVTPKNYFAPFSGISVDAASGSLITASRITDESAKSDLAGGVSSLKSVNCWTNLVHCSLLNPRFNPTNHVSLVGSNWTAVNEKFGQWGARFDYSNTITAPLAVGLSNCTVVITFWHDTLGGNDGTIDFCHSLGSLASSMDGSSVLLSSWTPYNGSHIWTATGTNWIYGGLVPSPETNELHRALSGTWNGSVRAFPFCKTTIAMSYNADGRVSAFINGSPSVFNVMTTNIVTLQAATAAFDRLNIGCGGTNWNRLGNAGGHPHTNAFLTEISTVQVYNQSCEQNTNIPMASYTFSLWVDPATVFVEGVGSSRQFFGTQWYNYPNGMPLTNAPWAILAKTIHPDWMVVNSAYPGSFLYQYTNMSGTYGGRYPFTLAVKFAPKKYTTRLIIEDSGRNDAFAGVATDTTVQRHEDFYRPYLNQGVQIGLFKSGFAGNISGSTNQLLQAYWLSQQTAFPFSQIYDEQSRLTSELLAAAAIDRVHFGMTNTAVGYRAGYAQAQMFADKTSYAPFVGGTNVTVSGNPFLFTNTFAYPVRFNISGGSLGGITRNGVTISLTNGVNSGLTLPVYSGDIVGITNTVAPTIWLDSTQM